MMTKEDKWAMDADKIIDRFIRGEMTEQEERQFHQRMADDKEFASRAQEAALLSKAMGIVGDRRDRAIVSSVSRMSEAEFKAMLSEPGDAVAPDKGRRRARVYLMIRLAAACAVLMLVLVGINYMNIGKSTRSTASMFNDYYKTSYNIKSAPFDARNDKVNVQGRRSTASYLEESSKMICSHNIREVRKGVKELEKLLTWGYKPELSHEIHWYLGLGYLKDNRIDDAMEQFHIVCDLNSPHKENAQKILRRLKRIQN